MMMINPRTPRSAVGLPAPAKLNLFLHVVGRRADGKHLLQSVFTLVDVCDEIDLFVRNDNQVTLSGHTLCAPEDDLCVRAARALQAAAPSKTLGVDIRVHKRIPAGAGMGGGSSDAATTLIGLNVLWNLGLSRQALARIGETLGADVPFFIWGRTSFVEGIGEQLQPFEIPESCYEILWPGVKISTAKIFSDSSLTRDRQTDKITVFSDHVRSFWPHLPGCNDLQPVAASIEPAVSEALALLERFGFEARMTGSGSAVFAVKPESRPPLDAEAVPAHWQRFSARGLAEHPLLAWTREQN